MSDFKLHLKNPLVVFDLETTGTSISNDRIVEIAMIKIDPDDPDYCIDCSYIGYVDTMKNGQISMLVDVEHEKIPIFLLPGFNFPNYLPSQQEKVFRLFNPDSNSISFTVSMLSGFVNLYISDTPKHA